jgi:formiminotetrahydrofolate cyclodeaminase
MEFSEYPISEFLTALASKEATPGGGGASALTAALGAALGNMVGNLTVGKETYKDVEADMYCLMNETAQLQKELTALIQKDADGFAPLAAAYKMDKNDPNYDAVMEQCLRDAAAVPMEVLRLSCRMIELHSAYAKKGSALAISDAATGAALCWAAMYGAAVNVVTNTRLMKDREYAKRMNAEADKLMNKYRKLAEHTYDSVYQTLKKEKKA